MSASRSYRIYLARDSIYLYEVSGTFHAPAPISGISRHYIPMQYLESESLEDTQMFEQPYPKFPSTILLNGTRILVFNRTPMVLRLICSLINRLRISRVIIIYLIFFKTSLLISISVATSFPERKRGYHLEVRIPSCSAVFVML